LKRKFTLHLDALIVISLLFTSSIAFNIYQMAELREASNKNFANELKLVENDLNLSSQKAYIEKLKKQLDEQSEK